MFFPTKKRLGELLLEAGIITKSQLLKALDRQKETNERIGKILIEMGYVTELSVVQVLESQFGIPYINLSRKSIDPQTVKLIPESMAQRYKVLPVSQNDFRLTLAMLDPLDVFAIDDVRITTGLAIDPVIALEADLEKAISKYFGIQESLEQIIGNLPPELADDNEAEIQLERLRELVEDAPIVKLVNFIITKGVVDRASDIHLEPGENQLRVRYRVDGVLLEMMNPPKRMQAPLISRIKIMADLDIAERRIPQDGRIQMKVENKDIDLRVSTLPTLFGEKIVLRILDKSRGLLALGDLGLLPHNLQRFQHMLSQSCGLLLVTGPTGSGKTTTLYAALNELNSPAKNVITLEDPVEYTLPGTNQVNLNNKAGLNFASGLRSVLRQDPDIIMVGEIRDQDTAKIAIQSAMTGHLVLSTLHTNSAASTLARLMDMGIESFLVAASIAGIVAQRLVRALCPDCKEAYEIPRELLQILGGNYGQKLLGYKAKGCPYCNQTGYMGRLALQELMIMDEAVRDLVIAKASADQIQQAAIQGGMRTIQQDGLDKVLQGITSLEEVMRAVHLMDNPPSA